MGLSNVFNVCIDYRKYVRTVCRQKVRNRDMAEQQEPLSHPDREQRDALQVDRNASRRQQDTTPEGVMPPTNDAGDAVSEGSLYDASGAATGGGVDLPTHVEKSTEDEVKKRQPLNQGSSAYTGGGADNGTDL